MYAIYLIASKNIKQFFKNYALLPMMIGIPLFQIYMMSSVLGSGPAMVDLLEGFTKLTIINQTAVGANLIDFYAASALVQFVFISAVVLNAQLVTERQENTYMRMLASPLEKWKIIVGNWIGNTIVLLLIAIIIILGSNLLFDVAWGNSIPKLIIVTLVTALASTSITYFLASFFKDSKTAGGAMSFTIIAMTFLSGGFTGEGTLQTLRLFTFNKYAVDGMLSVIRQQPNDIFLINILALAAMFIVCLVISTIIYERRDLNG